MIRQIFVSMKNAFLFDRLSVYRTSVIVMSASLLLLLPSCDFCRRLAGRPDSAEIEQMRVAMQNEELLKKQAAVDAAREDSLRSAIAQEKAMAAKDSLNAAMELEKKGVRILPVSNYGISGSEELSHRYYIVTGSYRMLPNAERQARDCRSAGYETVVIKLSNGYHLVTVSPSDRLSDIAAERVRVSKENFCPEDSWILVNDCKQAVPGDAESASGPGHGADAVK